MKKKGKGLTGQFGGWGVGGFFFPSYFLFVLFTTLLHPSSHTDCVDAAIMLAPLFFVRGGTIRWSRRFEAKNGFLMDLMHAIKETRDAFSVVLERWWSIEPLTAAVCTYVCTPEFRSMYVRLYVLMYVHMFL